MEAIITKIIEVAKYSSKFFAVIAILTAILLFTPNIFLEQMGVLQLITDFRPYVGIAFLVSGVVTLVNLIIFVYQKIISGLQDMKMMRLKEQRLHSLNPSEKAILQHYFTHKTNTQSLPINDGTVRELEGYTIIKRTSQLSKGGVIFPYNLNPWAREYLTKKPELLNMDEMELGMIARERNRGEWGW